MDDKDKSEKSKKGPVSVPPISEAFPVGVDEANNTESENTGSTEIEKESTTGTENATSSDEKRRKSADNREQDVQDDENQPITYEELRQLSFEINMLPGHKLMNIIKIVKNHQPELDNPSSKDFELDFELLKPVTVRAIEEFLKSCFPKRPRYDEYEFSEEEEEEVYVSIPEIQEPNQN